MKGISRACLFAVAAIAFPGTSQAHTGVHLGDGFGAGFLHPLSGADHLLAMFAVGLWSAQLGSPARWVLPIAFPLVMAVGGALGILGIPLPWVEVVVVLSVVSLGAVVALDLRPRLLGACGLVAGFALFHGHAHGGELPAAAAAIPFCAGFVIATALIHAGGISAGALVESRLGPVFLRAGGAAVSLAGVHLAWRLL